MDPYWTRETISGSIYFDLILTINQLIWNLTNQAREFKRRFFQIGRARLIDDRLKDLLLSSLLSSLTDNVYALRVGIKTLGNPS